MSSKETLVNSGSGTSSGPSMFKPSGGVNERKAYSAAFGADCPDETIISDPLGIRTGEEGYDRRPAIRKRLQPQYEAIDDLLEDGHSFQASMAHVASIQKGLNTTDYQLPVYPLEDLSMLAQRQTPFWDMLPKITSDTNTVEQDSVTGLAQPQIGGERDVPPDSDDTYQGQSLSMTYYRVTGSVSGPMQLASTPVRNAQGAEQQNKSQAMAHFGANLALNGDPTSGTTDGSITDERGFKGARTLAFDNSRTFNPVNSGGGVITKQDVRNNIQRVVSNGGSVNATIHLTDLKTLQDLKADLDTTNQVVISGPQGEIQVGAPAVRIDGTPVMHSDFMPTEPHDGTANPEGRQLLSLDMRFHSVHDLASLTMEPLAKTEDSDRFFMKRYSVYMMAAGASEHLALITGFE